MSIAMMIIQRLSVLIEETFKRSLVKPMDFRTSLVVLLGQIPVVKYEQREKKGPSL